MYSVGSLFYNKIYCAAKAVPTGFRDDAFGNFYADITTYEIYVPSSSYDAYRSALPERYCYGLYDNYYINFNIYKYNF